MHEIALWYRICHFWQHTRAQKISDTGVIWILNFQIMVGVCGGTRIIAKIFTFVRHQALELPGRIMQCPFGQLIP